MIWRKGTIVPTDKRRKSFEAYFASGHQKRFSLSLAGKVLSTMWMLHDEVTGTSHFLYATDLKDAKRVAANRIMGILKSKETLRGHPDRNGRSCTQRRTKR